MGGVDVRKVAACSCRGVEQLLVGGAQLGHLLEPSFGLRIRCAGIALASLAWLGSGWVATTCSRKRPEIGDSEMATGETGFGDVMYDLVSVQYHSLKAGHDYGQYVRDAKNAGLDDVAAFFEQVMTEDSERAQRCHEFLAKLPDNS